MHLRLELFPADLDAFFDFYTGVLAFEAVSYTHLTLPTNREV